MSDRLFNYRDNTRFESKHPQFENQTNLMKGILQTKTGELVEILNGTLVCKLTNANILTIADWLQTEDEIPATLKILGCVINVDFPESVPTHKMESLLEHFEYQ